MSPASLPLVLLPGTLCDERLFAEMRSALAPAVSVVADVGGRDSIGAMAGDVLAEAPEEFVAVGLSLGGIVAAEMASRAPQRVRGLALFDTNLGPVDEAQRAERLELQRLVRAGGFWRMIESTVSRLTADPVAHGELIVSMARRIGPAAFLRQNTAIIERTEDRRGVPARYPHPVLVAYGTEDSVCGPTMHAELVARRPDAELAAIPGAGHLATIDQPEACARLLAGWLATAATQSTHTNMEVNIP